MSMPFYVSPEQLMKDRADFARKGIARGRSWSSSSTPTASCSSPRTSPRRCTRSPRSTTGSRSPRSAATTSSRTCGSPASAWPTCAATPTTAATSPAAGWPTPTPRRSARSSPAAARSPTRSRSSSPRSATPPTDDQIYRLTYDGQVADEHGYVVMGGAADVVSGYLAEHYQEGASLAEALTLAVAALGRSTNERGEPDDRVIPVKDLEVAVLDRTRSPAAQVQPAGSEPARVDAR